MKNERNRYSNHYRGNCLLLACSGLVLASCGTTPDQGEVEGHSAAIYNGTVISAEQSGHVWVVGYCSGELLYNDLVLTAKHCFGAGEVANPASVSLTMGSQTKTADRIVLQPGDFYHDSAIVHVSQPFTMGGDHFGIHPAPLHRNNR
jgi:hypothetical protein